MGGVKNLMIYEEDILMHHGIKGQKWGKRRWTNYDGSLTPAGRERYGKENTLNENVLTENVITEKIIRENSGSYYEPKTPRSKGKPRKKIDFPETATRAKNSIKVGKNYVNTVLGEFKDNWITGSKAIVSAGKNVVSSFTDSWKVGINSILKK